jgi:hypothetical protein
MKFLNTGLKGVTHISTCDHCHFKIIGDGVKWYCDSLHPEILEQIVEERLKEEIRQNELWYCRGCFELVCSKCGKCHNQYCDSFVNCIS